MTAVGFSFKKIRKSPKSNKLGGYDDEVLVCPVDYITSMPALPDEITKEEDKVLATGTFVFKDGCTGFRSIMAQSNSVGFSPETAGPDDSKCYNQKSGFNIAGDSLETDAFMQDSISYKFIYAIKKGDYYSIIGTISRPAQITAKPNYGKKAEDGVVHEFDVACFSETPAMKFAGPIPIAPEI
jgi:hypothetical protein